MKVAIKDIKPNPFRHLERYPIDPNKVAELKRSIKETGWWGNIVVRKVNGGGVELAYGHHRLAALKEIHGKRSKKEVSIIIKTLDDEKMLKIMAKENMQEWSHDFSVDMETVRTVVEAYGDGKIELPAPAPKAQHIRFAPHFKKLSVGDPMDKAAKPYTAKSIAKFLGWTQPSGQPNDKTKCALAALELIEEGILKDDDFRDLSTAQAKAVVQQTIESFRINKDWLKGEEKGGNPERVKQVQTMGRRNVIHTGKAVSEGLRSGAIGTHQAASYAHRVRVEKASKEKDPIERLRYEIEDIAQKGRGFGHGLRRLIEKMEKEGIEFKGPPTYHLDMAVQFAEEGIAAMDYAFPTRKKGKNRKRGTYTPGQEISTDVISSHNDDTKPDNEADVVDAEYEMVDE